MWLDRDGVMVSLLNHTLALEQALQDNCWTVKVESCGFTVLRSYDSRFLWWGRIVFPLNDLNISPQAQPQNNKSSTVHFRLVMAFAWNTSLLSRNLSNENMSMHLSMSFEYSTISPFYSLLLPFFWLSLNLKSKICLNWLQRAQGGFVSMVMRVLIGPEAQAANRPLLVCWAPLLAR